MTVLTVLLDIVLSVLGRDAWGWLPRLSRGVIWLQTAPLPRARREVRREEWYGELAAEYDDRRVTGFVWAVSLSRISAWERLTTPIALPAKPQWTALTASEVEWSPVRIAVGLTVMASVTAMLVASVGMLGFLRGEVLARFAAYVGLLFIGTVFLWFDERKRDARRRCEIAPAKRRMWVLEILDNLGHVSEADSIGALRILAREADSQSAIAQPESSEFTAPRGVSS